MKLKHLTILSIIICFISTPLTAGQVNGTAYVIDGDTIDVEGNRIRLYGIDALENGQTCNSIFNGEISKRYLIGLLANQSVSCETNGLDIYKRHIAKCFINGKDIAKIMLDRGLVFAYQYRKSPTDEYKYLDKNYANLEKAAAKKDLGLHSISCERPHIYRKNNYAR